MDEAPVSGIPPLAGARRELGDGRIIISLAGEGLRELIVGRWINRVERQLLCELHSRGCRTTRARQDPTQLIREMAGQWIQLDGPTRLGLGFVEASERPKIDAEHLVRLRVVRIELKSAAKQWFGGRPPPMKARRRLCNERVREAERGVDLQRAAGGSLCQWICLARRHYPIVCHSDVRVAQAGVRGRVHRIPLDGLCEQSASSRDRFSGSSPQEVPALERS